MISCALIGVVMRPTITAPLTNIRAEEGKTVNFDCAAIATTMSDWTLFTWLKNGDTIQINTAILLKLILTNLMKIL